jgi:ATP-dependent protease HslVU (ClpYQ) peptidase subunit
MLNSERRPRLRFRGEGVTICIAAICEKLKKIILVSDRLVSLDWTSASGVRKLDFLTSTGPWLTMFAGSEAHRFEPLRDRIGELLLGKNTLSLAAVSEACHDAYRVELLRKIEMEVLLPSGWTREDFLKYGKTALSTHRYEELEQLVTKATLGVDLLVAGFDSNNQPQIFEICNGAIVVPPLSYHAIGSGGPIALSTLHGAPDCWSSRNFEEMAYHVCVAKFSAERAAGVGPDTTFVGLSQNEFLVVGDDVLLNKVRSAWKTKGRQIPRGAIKLLSSGLLRVPRRAITG